MTLWGSYVGRNRYGDGLTGTARQTPTGNACRGCRPRLLQCLESTPAVKRSLHKGALNYAARMWRFARIAWASHISRLLFEPRMCGSQFRCLPSYKSSLGSHRQNSSEKANEAWSFQFPPSSRRSHMQTGASNQRMPLFMIAGYFRAVP